jgi:hypothetical protein
MSRLALDLEELDTELLQPAGVGNPQLATINGGHGMTEVAASVSSSCCSASCCLACCCCCG